MQPSLPQRIIKMNHTFGLRENKPNQTQFFLIPHIFSFQFCAGLPNTQLRKKFLWQLPSGIIMCLRKNLDTPGELKAGRRAGPKLRNHEICGDPTNLLGLGPAKGGR